MSLKERIDLDRHRVFMQTDHFADTHKWNGKSFTCVVDEDAALKRKNNNVNDIYQSLLWMQEWEGHVASSSMSA